MMALRSLGGKFLTTTAVVTFTAVGAYGIAVNRRISPVERSQITTLDEVRSSMTEGSFRKIVNLKKHPSMADGRYITLDIPPHLQHVSDEALLAKFTKGFYCGLVLGPERLALGTLKATLTYLPALEKPQTPVWSSSEISDETLPSVNTMIFGTFQVSDIHLAPQNSSGQPGDSTESYIDFVFGNNPIQFAGVHRFSVIRSAEQGKVQIYLQSSVCNPVKDKPLKPEFMFSFHKMYSMLLFRDGVAEIKKWIDERSA